MFDIYLLCSELMANIFEKCVLNLKLLGGVYPYRSV